MKRILLLLVCVCVGTQAQHLQRNQRSADITVQELTHHVRYLASDELEGRRAGSPGAERAAQYIAAEFATYGLEPLGENGSFFQNFEFVADVRLRESKLAVVQDRRTSSYVVNKDFRPLGFSTSGSFSGGVVFAGYGISAPTLNYDDYAGLDVNGKAVLVLRYAPKSDTARVNFNQHAALRYKASRAKELGASLLLVVTGPEDADGDELMRLTYEPSAGNAGIMAINITQAVANQILLAEQVSIKDLQNEINRTLRPNSRVLKGITLNVTVGLEEVRKTTSNVIGFLRGSDPTLRDEVIVIGAHYDHLGWGGEGSGSLKPDTVAIHNGADDNASGTAGLLELAQALSARRSELRRSILFIAFGAEELGLLGSAYYVKMPVIPLERKSAMLNMDMIGRLDNRKLIVYGVGTSPRFEALVHRHNAQPGADSLFALRLVRDGFGPSDHASFYGKQIPVFHFFTDIHPDYHRPSDTWDRINYEGMASVVRYVKSIALDLSNADERPQYVAVEMPRTAGSGRSSGVYMGTVPDFGEQVEGMKLSGVREGSPAAKAGLRAGDTIIKFGRIEIKNLYDFTYALGEYKPGDEVELMFKRGEEVLTTTVKLERRR